MSDIDRNYWLESIYNSITELSEQMNTMIELIRKIFLQNIEWNK